MNRVYLFGGRVALAVAILLGGLTACQAGVPTSVPSLTPEPPSPVTAKATILPHRQAHLSFRVLGQIAATPKLGDEIAEGQEIARLDTAELDLAVAQAADAVAVNEALLAQAEAPARPADLASLQAAFEGAQAKHNQLLRGSTKADLASAASAVASAEAALADARQRQAALDTTSAQRAAEIHAAELALEQAKNTLWATQIDRDGIKGNGAMPEYMGHAADARVAAAETAVTQAAATLQAKKTGPTEGERQAAAEAVASAAAALAAAQAKLEQLRSGVLPGDKEASAAQVLQAKAALELKQAGAAPADRDVLKARLKQSQTALAQAKAARRAAVITSPFAGVVVWTSGNVGETVAPGTPVVTVADLSALQVETTDLDEAGAALLKVGMPVNVRVNAFADKVLPGKIGEIAPLATTTASGDANYTVRIALDAPDPALRLGMTARVEFPVGR